MVTETDKIVAAVLCEKGLDYLSEDVGPRAGQGKETGGRIAWLLSASAS